MKQSNNEQASGLILGSESLEETPQHPARMADGGADGDAADGDGTEGDAADGDATDADETDGDEGEGADADGKD